MEKIDDIRGMLGQSYMRLGAAVFVSMFGSDEQREKVNRLFDGKLPVEEAEQTRAWLDRVAARF